MQIATPVAEMQHPKSKMQSSFLKHTFAEELIRLNVAVNDTENPIGYLQRL